MFLDQGRDLRAHPGRPRRFVDHHGPAGFADGLGDCFYIDRIDGAQIDQFDADVFRQMVDGREALENHRAPAEDGDVPAFLQHLGLADGDGVRVFGHFFLERPVHAFGLEENDRIGIAQC